MGAQSPGSEGYVTHSEFSSFAREMRANFTALADKIDAKTSPNFSNVWAAVAAMVGVASITVAVLSSVGYLVAQGIRDSQMASEKIAHIETAALVTVVKLDAERVERLNEAHVRQVERDLEELRERRMKP